MDQRALLCDIEVLQERRIGNADDLQTHDSDALQRDAESNHPYLLDVIHPNVIS